MKVKALIDCVGVGYSLEKGEEATLKKELANKLIRFKYVEEIKVKTSNKETKVK